MYQNINNINKIKQNKTKHYKYNESQLVNNIKSNIHIVNSDLISVLR